jgi:hypothetical protein
MKVIPLRQRRTLTEVGLRVVKTSPRAIVLTEGSTLQLWRECSRYEREALTVRGKDYRFERMLRGRELQGSWAKA